MNYGIPTLLLKKVFTTFFTEEFSFAAVRMISILRAYRVRILVVAVLSIMVVLLDILSAIAVGGLLLAIDGVGTIALPSVGEIPNPLHGFPKNKAIIYCILSLVGLQLLREISILINDLFVRKLGIDIVANTRDQISNIALSIPFEEFGKMKQNDLVVYGTNFSLSVGMFATEIAKMLGTLVVIFFYSLFFFFLLPVGFISVIVIVFVLIALTNRVLLRLEGLSHKSRNLSIKYHNQLQDTVDGLRDITIFGRRYIFLDKVQRITRALTKMQWATAFSQAIITPLQRSVALLFLGGGLIFLVALDNGGKIAIESEKLIFIIFIMLRLYGPVSQMNTIRSSLLSRAGPVSIITEFFNNLGSHHSKMDIDSNFRAKSVNSKTLPDSIPSKCQGDITFSKVSYDYDGNGKKALLDVDFTIPYRATTAIVGPSGSGKSTIVDLLTCLRIPTNGIIQIDGTKLSEVNTENWRSKVATIHQLGHIFHGTISENITLFSDSFSTKEIQEAISRANFDDFVDSLPLGLETQLGRSDIPLSGGQRQRLQIARAFLVNPQLLILDEATSAQDALLEEALLKSIKKNFPKATILVIAHRFSAIREADHIIVLNDGQVSDAGDRKTLIKRSSLFRDLLNAQSTIVESEAVKGSSP